MKDLKKTLKLAGILCLISALLCVGNILIDIFMYEFSLYFIITDSLSILLTLATSITYFVLMKKPVDYIISHKQIFLVLSILNIFNNVLVWIITFWVQIVIGQHATKRTVAGMFRQERQYAQETSNPDVIIVDDYEIHTAKETLVTRLEELTELRNKHLITEEEYCHLREEAIQKFMN